MKEPLLITPSDVIETEDEPAEALVIIGRTTLDVLALTTEGSCGITIVLAVVIPSTTPTSMSASVSFEVAVLKASSQRWAP